MKKAVIELIRIGLAMIGIFLLIDDGGKAYEAYVSQFWPTTSGEITRSAVENRADALGNRSYHASIRYTYVDESTKDNSMLVGNRIEVDSIPAADTPEIIEEKVAAFPKGAKVQVYYNPSRPEKSVLEPKFSFRHLIMPNVGLLCVCIAVSLWWVERVASR